MDDSQTDPVRDLLEKLKADPSSFQRTGGYERLLALLQAGHSPTAVKALLHGNAPFVGDILWTVCELDNLEPYVQEAARHICDSDKGTASYALEVVLRAAENTDHLQAALERLDLAPNAVREHAILVLASQGLVRARDIFRLGSWTWAAVLTDELLAGSCDAVTTIKTLLGDSRSDRLLVGATLATLASEQDGRAVQILEQSETEWVRNLAGQLRRMFQHKWRTQASTDSPSTKSRDS